MSCNEHRNTMEVSRPCSGVKAMYSAMMTTKLRTSRHLLAFRLAINMSPSWFLAKLRIFTSLEKSQVRFEPRLRVLLTSNPHLHMSRSQFCKAFVERIFVHRHELSAWRTILNVQLEFHDFDEGHFKMTLILQHQFIGCIVAQRLLAATIMIYLLLQREAL
jgi:hypothetical protein